MRKYFVIRFLLLSVFFISSNNILGIDLYTYKSGSWNDLDTWTTDPGGTTLVGSQIPANGDVVTILPSRTITLPGNIATTTLDITINSGGVLDQGAFSFTSGLTALRGAGTLLLNSVNFPTATTNTFVNVAGGLTEYYNVSGTLSQTTYNNINIKKTDNNATNYTLIIASNITINGNISISRTQGTGSAIVTVGNNATSRAISILGDLTVSDGGILNIGNFNAIHTFSLSGNLTNSGVIDLSNTAQYATATNGAAIFTFTGNSDNSLICNGQTDFYRFILNKGTDRTYILSVTSNNSANFNLFGPVTATGGDYSTLALVLQNGTLKLRSAVNIPALGKNTGAGTIREFHIPNTAGLWIDGATVATSDDGGGWRGLTVYGLFRISDGTFTNQNNTGGITYFGNIGSPGYIYIEGGTVNTTQLKQADINGRVTYHQTGGRFNITGYADSRGSSAVFALPTSDFEFTMSGGEVYIAGVNTTTTNGIDIQVSSSNYNVTGGTFTVLRPSGADDQADFEINSTVPFYNLVLKDTSLAGTNTGYILQSNLVVFNDLTIEDETLDAANFDVTVGGDFTINSGATYIPGTNTTTINGAGNNSFFYEGAITSGFNNLVLDKTGGSIAFSRSSPTTIPVRGTFDLLGGTFDYDGNTINVSGNITNSGTHSGSGVFTLVGTAAQTIGGDGNGVFQNITLNNTNGANGSYPVSLTADISVNGTLTLQSARVFNISNYGLLLTSTGALSGTFSATRFIATTGEAGDKGITKTFSSNSFSFPIGVIPTAVRYTPTTITLSTTPTAYGSVTVFPVDGEQMQTSANGKNRSLTYFWRVRSSGFTLGSANVTQTFVYDQSDVVTGGNVSENGYVPARFNQTTYTWNNGTTANVNAGSNLISWPNGVSYIDGDYTAGDNSPQDPFGVVDVYYSAQNGNWRTRSTWVTDTVTMDNVPNSFPDANGPAVIRNGHTVSCDRNNNASGNLQIQATGILNCASYNALNFGVVSNHPNGSGKIRISSGGATAIFPSGDFTEFLGPNGGTVEYYTSGTDFTIPTTSASSLALSYYCNLTLTPASGRLITMPNINLNVYNDLTIQGASATGIVRLNTTTARTLNISRNITLTGGNLQFRNGQSQTLTVGGNISLASGSIFDVQNTGATTNTLSISGSLTNNGTLNFNNSNSCDVTFTGSTNAALTGSGNTTLRYLTINKGTSQTPTLTINVSGATFSTPTNGWLTLTNGTLIFSRPSNFNITTTSAFTIPTTAGLNINNASANVYIGNANSNTNDLYLNGKLTLVNGTIYVGPAAAPNNNNDIEYSSSGSSAIAVQGGTLIVNGQIRRNSSGTGGVLVYNQTGGAVTINGNNNLATRAKLEIENTGSVFSMSAGTLTILRGGGTTFGDLYLRPASGTVSGGTIQLGTFNVGGTQTFNFDANLALNNLILNGVGSLNTFQLMVNPLALNGNLTISNVNSSFNANGIDVSLKGNFTNNGTYTTFSNTTTFNGATQTLNATTATQFNNLTFSPSNSVTLYTDITVMKDLRINSGTLSSSTYDINAEGDVANYGIHSGDAAQGGIVLNGTSSQNLSGSGTYGRLELNNWSGAVLLNNISLQQDLLLTNGILNINQYLLTLGINTDIVGSGFSASKMIEPNGVYSNVGIRKYFSAGANTFTFPIGVSGKYTPAKLTINASSSSGSVRMNCINDYHPTVLDNTNVLHYYWEVESSGISGLDGNLVLYYDNGDVFGAESDYVAARLIIPGTDWSKAATGATTDNVDEVNDSIWFGYSGSDNLSGEYTCGTDPAIPNTVPVYTSNQDGDWDDENIWTPVSPAGGPNGFIVIISAGDSVSTNGNSRFAYRTEVYGVLDLNSSYGHNLGTITGTGKLRLESPVLPAGRFDDFFSCTGGTIEFGGSSSYTIIADRIDTVNSIYFTGTGTRTMANKNLVVCNLLRIDGVTLNNSVNNKKITLFGSIERINGGSFISGSGADATVAFSGSSAQLLGGASGNFTGSNAFNNLEINNSSGLTFNGAQELNGNLILTNGIITTTSANSLTMLTSGSSVTPPGGSASSFVNGPMSKEIFEGDNFDFPIGKGTRYGKLSLISAGSGLWNAEYFNVGYSDLTVTAPIINVSTNEYWSINSPSAGKTATVKLRWDSQSDITPLTTTSGITDIRVAEFNGSDWIEKSTVNPPVGTDYNGTAQTTGDINIDPQLYTLGSISVLKGRAAFVSIADVCIGDDIEVAFSNATGPYTFTYTINGAPTTVNNTSDNPYTITSASSGVYLLTNFVGGIVDINTATVNALPVVSLDLSAVTPVCDNTAAFSLNQGTPSGGTYSGLGITTSPVFNASIAGIGTATITYSYTDVNTCSNTANDDIVVTAAPSPSITSGLTSTCELATNAYTTDGVGTLTWSVTGGTISSGQGTNTVNIQWNVLSPVGTLSSIRILTIQDSNGTCSGTGNLNVTVNRVPQTGPQYHIENSWGN
jgi:hypothetical protein